MEHEQRIGVAFDVLGMLGRMARAGIERTAG
jgi:hypothetical protein